MNNIIKDYSKLNHWNGIDLLEKAEDFPKDGPLLIITDGYCGPFKIHRDHVFLMPKGSNLPFLLKGKFYPTAFRAFKSYNTASHSASTPHFFYIFYNLSPPLGLTFA